MFYNARYYDAYLNRFIQADTIVPNPYNPQDFNRYTYTRNNPLRYTDPSGHCVPLCIGVGIAIALVVMLANPASSPAPSPLALSDGELAFLDSASGSGDISDAWAVLTERRLFTGETQSRAEAAVFAGLPIITGGVAKLVGKGITAFHATKNAKSVLNGIDSSFFQETARFGKGFYISQDAGTAIVESKGAKDIISYVFGEGKAKMLDLTKPEVAKEWGYIYNSKATETHQRIAQEARAKGYNVIKYESLEVPGNFNYVIFEGWDDLLTPIGSTSVPLLP